MFLLLKIIAFEPVPGISLIFEENSCDQQATCYQAVLTKIDVSQLNLS